MTNLQRNNAILSCYVDHLRRCGWPRSSTFAKHNNEIRVVVQQLCHHSASHSIGPDDVALTSGLGARPRSWATFRIRRMSDKIGLPLNNAVYPNAGRTTTCLRTECIRASTVCKQSLPVSAPLNKDPAIVRRLRSWPTGKPARHRLISRFRVAAIVTLANAISPLLIHSSPNLTSCL